MSVAQEQTILDKIRTRGYWRVVIRPAVFERKPYPELLRSLPDRREELGPASGVGLPARRPSEEPAARGADWVGQETDCRIVYRSLAIVHERSVRPLRSRYGRLAGQLGRSGPADREGTWAVPLLFTHHFCSLSKSMNSRLVWRISAAGSGFMRVEVQAHRLQGHRLASSRMMTVLL